METNYLKDRFSDVADIEVNTHYKLTFLVFDSHVSLCCTLLSLELSIFLRIRLKLEIEQTNLTTKFYTANRSRQ
jgi:hypothetical protein